MLDHPERRFVFGYEQALGYLVADRPLDKDGITAAVLLAEVAARGQGRGRHAAGPARRHRRALRPPRHRRALGADEPAGDAARSMDALRADAADGARRASPSPSVEDFPAADLLRLHCGDGARVQVRPSGTEPKVKIYVEAVGADPGPAPRRARRAISASSA